MKFNIRQSFSLQGSARFLAAEDKLQGERTIKISQS